MTTPRQPVDRGKVMLGCGCLALLVGIVLAAGTATWLAIVGAGAVLSG